MINHEKTEGMFSRLREQAQEIIRQRSEDIPVPPQYDIMALIQELNIHQVELEIQNEELRRAQAEISLLHKEYSDLYEFAPCGYITLDSKEIITHCNLSCVTILGLDRTRLIGGGFGRFVSSESRNDFYLALKKSEEKKDKATAELLMVKPDGEPVWVRLDIQSEMDEPGRLIQRRLVFLDITEKREMEMRLLESQKMESIGTLAGGIAHDFNNILFPIVGHIEMLMDDLSEESSAIRDSLNQIYSSSLRARDLVQQILTFARYEINQLKLMKMQPIIKEAMKLIRSTIPTTISINQNLQPDCGPVTADPTQIHQIVMNLATNAYHAMEENGGELKVNLKEIKLGKDDLIDPDMSPGLYACLTIGDTGVGMYKEVMNRIFDPYFTTKEKGKGTGMGLAVVHGIVKGMMGDIRVYSEPGKGTEFQVYLPVVGDASEKPAAKADDPIQRGGESILLVDDEDAIIKMEKLILERLGYQVTTRPGSIEAFEAFRADPDTFDLVITDMSMPNLSGDKLASELMKIRPDIPILLCTGYSESMSDEKIQSLGIKGFLMKPIMIKEFARKIRDVLDESRNA